MADFLEKKDFESVKRDCRVCVIIPVKDEAENIALTLGAFARQVDLNGQPLDKNTFEIIVFANNCADNSAVLIENWRRKNSLNLHLIEKHLPPEKANVGYVRRWLMNEAERRLLQNRFGRGVIMTTDGDTCVAPDWIAANLKEIETGAEAVGGRILIKPEDLRRMNANARRFHLFDNAYRLAAAEIEARLDPVSDDPAPRHHQHFNASFAVTTETFRRAGGVPEVRFLEDVAFYHALLRVDARVRHSSRVRVYTSSRNAGRVECGLSTQIGDWLRLGETGETFLVESAAAIAARVNSRRTLREFWCGREKSAAKIARLAEDLLIAPEFLKDQLAQKESFGLLVEKVYAAQSENGEWARKYPLACVTRALAELRVMLVALRRNQSQPPVILRHTSSR